MRKERCLHTNISSESGIKLNEYTGKGIPLCISRFLNSEKGRSHSGKTELKPLQTFLDNIPVPVFYKDIESKYSGCNRAFMEFIGDPNPKVQFSEIKYDTEFIENSCANDMKLSQKNGTSSCESIIKIKNGGIKYALINKAIITNSKGETCGFIGMISDITTNRLLKDALNTSAGSTDVSRDTHFKELTAIKQKLFDENKKRRRLEKELAKASRKIEEYIKQNAEKSAAMKEINKYQEDYKKEIEGGLISNVKHLIMPYLVKLKQQNISPDELDCLNMIESRLNEIAFPLLSKTSSMRAGFTPKETQIVDLIKEGKQDKDIMNIMNISIDTVKTHRKNIRRKLGIYGNRSNLKSTLFTLSN